MSAIDELWTRLQPHRNLLGQDRELTLAWLKALTSDPGRPTLIEEVNDALAKNTDLEHVLTGCAALNAAAETKPMDVIAQE